MQSSYKEIYKITAARTGHDEKLYKDIGNFIQKRTAQLLKRPPSLIIRLKGVGWWYLRRQRMLKCLSYYPENYEETHAEFVCSRPFLNAENKWQLYQVFKARLRDYDRFLELKRETQQKRHEAVLASQKTGPPPGEAQPS